MPEYMEVCRTTEIENGQMRAISIYGQEILVAKAENKIYAASNICPHMKAKLSRGTLKGTMVTCPRHASQFDLRDGHVLRWTNWSGIKLSISKTFRSPQSLKTYPVKVEGDRILTEV